MGTNMKARLFYLILLATLVVTAFGTSLAAVRSSDKLFYIPFAVAASFATVLFLVFVVKRWRDPTLPKNGSIWAVSLAFLASIWAFFQTA